MNIRFGPFLAPRRDKLICSEIDSEAEMMGNAVVTAPRQDLLEELRGRLNARVAAVEKRLQALGEEFEKLALEHIELSAELRVLEDQVLKCKGRAD